MTIAEVTSFLANNLTALVGGTIGLLFGVIPILFLYRIYKRAGDETDILENGYRCPAVILEVWETGARSGTSQYMGMRLDIRPKLGPAYETKLSETIVPQSYLSKLQPGAIVPVRIARHDRDLVALDLEYGLQAPPAPGSTQL
ncbi:MAG: hypothetical protein OEV92_07500 [Nitrospinota bacterium]|nr:hypothetical protein [Nitrospinota bacterium]